MIKMYIHSGSGNHGCEAIVRATKNVRLSDGIIFF